MQPNRSVMVTRSRAWALTEREPLRFHLILFALMVLLTGAWMLASTPFQQQSEGDTKEGVLPAIAKCEPGTDNGESALLRCARTPVDNRLKDI